MKPTTGRVFAGVVHWDDPPSSNAYVAFPDESTYEYPDAEGYTLLALDGPGALMLGLTLIRAGLNLAGAPVELEEAISELARKIALTGAGNATVFPPRRPS